MTSRSLRSIVATTDVRSSLDGASALLGFLERVGSQSLVTDCGDFFEGSGYFRLGGGTIERRILTACYDVVVPGAHGWRHYLAPEILAKTVCANIQIDGASPFRPMALFDVAGRRVAVTGVIGADAFGSISEADRAHMTCVEPVDALRDLHRQSWERYDDLVVLSHSGFRHDLQLAAACQFVSAIFSGRCDSVVQGPERVGAVLVVQPAALGYGLAVGLPRDGRWYGEQHAIPISGRPDSPAQRAIAADAAGIAAELATPLGPLDWQWSRRVPERASLAASVASAMRTLSVANTAVLNLSALRPLPLGGVLTLGTLLAVEPFGGEIVIVTNEDGFFNGPELHDQLTAQLGPVTFGREAIPDSFDTLATTDHIAATCFRGEFPVAAIAPLTAVVRAVLRGEPIRRWALA